MTMSHSPVQLGGFHAAASLVFVLALLATLSMADARDSSCSGTAVLEIDNRLKSDIIHDLIGESTQRQRELGACKRQKRALEVAGKYQYHYRVTHHI
jgi:hypothetical protein